MTEPTMIPCEGSNCGPTVMDAQAVDVGMCAMCGVWLRVWAGGLMPTHERRDILAGLDRGDFG